MNAMKLKILETLRTKSNRIKEHLRLTYGEDLVKYNSETPAVLKTIVVSTVYRYIIILLVRNPIQANIVLFVNLDTNPIQINY